MSSNTAFKTFYFKQVRNPKFQDIKPFEFNINLLGDIELLPQTEASSSSLVSSRESKINQLKSELKSELAKAFFKQYRNCWPDLLDDEIFVKIENCIDLAIICHPFIPGCEKDTKEIIRITSARTIMTVATDEILAGCFDESSAEDEEEEEFEDEGSDDLLQNMSYSLMVQFLPMMNAGFQNKNSFEEQANKFPTIDGTFGILLQIIRHQSHEMENPLFKNYGGNQGFAEKNWKLFEKAMFSKILLHREWSNQSKKCNYYSLDTYYSFLQHAEGVLANLDTDAMCYEGLQLSSFIEQDLLFKRLRSVYGQVIAFISAMLRLHSDIESKHYWKNIILNRYFMMKRQEEVTNGKKKAQTLKEIVDSILIKIEEGIIDMELICKQLYKCFPDDTQVLSKYFQILKCTFNGRLTYYSENQK